MKKIIFGLIICGSFLNFESHAQRSNLSTTSEKKEYSFDNKRNNQQSIKSVPDIKKFITELETYKLDLKSCIANLRKIKNILDNMEFSKKIQELEGSLQRVDKILSDINHRQNQSHVQTEENEISEEKNIRSEANYVESFKSIEAFEKNLKGFHSALQNSGTRFNAILNKGHKLFDNKKNRRLFNPKTQNSSDQKNVFEKIYYTRYPEAFTAWLEVKRMTNSDKNFTRKLNNFKTKVKLLYEDVVKIK